MCHLEGSCTPGLPLLCKEALGLQDQPHKPTELMTPLQQDEIQDDPRELHTELQLETQSSCAQGGRNEPETAALGTRGWIGEREEQNAGLD